MWIIIIVAIALVLVFWFISVQRRLVNCDENCSNAMSQIGVQQQSRWDALTALAELTKGYSEHEYNALRDIIAMRQGVNGNSTAKQVDEQEELISKALQGVNVVIERYPDLKANTTYIKTMDSVNTYENQVRTSRMVYNDSVTIYNRLIRQFPSSIVASMLHFDKKDYLQENPATASMPSMKL
ncbi:MAG: LemA family protein [Bacteroidales bacterium]|nr:LemA family protein [Bacteroidales bacterium]